MIDKLGELLRRQLRLVSVTVAKMHHLALRKKQLIAHLARIALHVHELAALFDSVVVNIIGIVRVFTVARRHTHERGLFVSPDKRVLGYEHLVPLFGRFHVLAVVFLAVLVCRFFVFEIVHALRPRPVARFIADGDGKILLPLHDRDISAVLVLRDAHDLIPSRRFFQIFVFCQIFFLLLLFRVDRRGSHYILLLLFVQPHDLHHAVDDSRVRMKATVHALALTLGNGDILCPLPVFRAVSPIPCVLPYGRCKDIADARAAVFLDDVFLKTLF